MGPIGPDLFKMNMEIFKQNRKLILVEGCLFFALGCLAISAPVLWSFGADIFLGLLFLVGGVAQSVRTWKTWEGPGSWLACFSALLMLIAGVIMLVNPIIGLVAITTILGIYFFFDGIAKCALTFQLAVGTHKFWVFLSGVISFILAIMIFAGLPEISSWILGLFVGINMLLTGIMLISFYATLPRQE
jgi:uncharacterized membrane protein HdeD (DUF308 family)